MSDILYTQSQIEALGERSTRFLAAASQVPLIRGALSRGGYTEAEHARGWELVLELNGYKQQSVPAEGASNQLRQREAVAQLDAWDGPAFDRAHAALDHHHPAQSEYIFDSLTAKAGADCIGSVSTFLDRCAILRDGTDPARAGTREQDAAAIALLASRNIVDANEEARLRALIRDAISLADMPSVSEPDPNRRQAAALALDAWLRDWRETARVLVTRRDHQIRLGLAERRANVKEEPEVPAVPTPDSQASGDG